MLLSSQEFRDTLQDRLLEASDRVVILSAFLKLDALNWLIQNMDVEKITVVSRWRPGDLLSGSSDLTCYQLCKNRQIDFGISLGLHGKVYCVDEHILVGSANATSSGLALKEHYNEEFGYGFIAGNADRLKMNRYLSSVTWLDDFLMREIEAELADIPDKAVANKTNWSQALTSKLKRSDGFLWVHEIPFLSPIDLAKLNGDQSDSLKHDLELFGLSTSSLSQQNLIQAFRSTRSFAWLYDIVKNEGSISFGGLTAAFHNSLLDDPLPYRRDVKQLVSNLISWAVNDPEFFEVYQPRHSQIIRLSD